MEHDCSASASLLVGFWARHGAFVRVLAACVYVPVHSDENGNSSTINFAHRRGLFREKTVICDTTEGADSPPNTNNGGTPP